MSEDILKPKDISKPIEMHELLNLKFFIPSYQRGYRWQQQQIIDLLTDIYEFDETKSFYCLQPIVVKQNDEKKCWNLVDGQQRLTTIVLIVRYFNQFFNGEDEDDIPDIQYETRPESSDFLKNIVIDKETNTLPEKMEKLADSNIDFKHMETAYKTIHSWMTKNLEKPYKRNFQDKFLRKTCVIWYELPETEREVDSFTRLNIGKIPLTNAELIKALFLNKSNFLKKDGDESLLRIDSEIRLIQQQIAVEWDKIESSLQNDEFWLFIHEKDYNKPNRIDFIFDLIQKNDLFNLELSEEKLGSDNLASFRYISKLFSREHFSNNKDGLIRSYWEKVKSYFQIFEEWFNNIEYYHYIGFLVEMNGSSIIPSLIKKWNTSKSRDDFRSFILESVKEKVNKYDLAQEYEAVGKPSKRKAIPILLLHNIVTVINQNKLSLENDRYGLSIYYKFPFHLYKKEEWDVEHIDSNIGNTLEDLKDKQEWIITSFEEIEDSKEKDKLKTRVKDFIQLKEDTDNTFDSLNKDLLNILHLDNQKMDSHEKIL
ncbi:hypothetical protein MSI_21860 [Treponema sp. JC4]|uniref:DUF262 domain-containing protein n=1 Tax=Treponema sp. JC4 TaxID=1124982 RepID=UPI00025B0E75|nr:DUF262 domain-containing protein [Treponema sp. JC4]EID84353.1 hypothetical protein MSI_21860 [Treponema sp. JC4]